MIVHAQPGVGFGFMAREGEMEAVVADELRQEALALGVAHQAVEQEMTEPRGRRQHRGDVGIAGRQLLGHDAAGEMIGAGAAAILRQGQRAQAHLRGLVDELASAAAGRATSSRSALSATGLISRVTKSRTVSRISSCSALR